jgi:hypothetical protein
MKVSVQVIVHPDDDTEASPVVREILTFDRVLIRPCFADLARGIIGKTSWVAVGRVGGGHPAPVWRRPRCRRTLSG